MRKKRVWDMCVIREKGIFDNPELKIISCNIEVGRNTHKNLTLKTLIYLILEVMDAQYSLLSQLVSWMETTSLFLVSFFLH